MSVTRRRPITSTVTRKLLYGKSAATVKRVSLELGGHAPFVVLPGANARRAAVGASLVKFLNTGQACISPNRLYVHRSAHDEFVDELVRRVSALKVGPGVEDGVSVGPLIDEAAMDKMQRQVADATGKGAAVLTGGSASSMARGATGSSSRRRSSTV
jgi:succinate-semialdehyde dehydrogenase / glutarate-semialdehyde dehydrogenase